MLLIDLSACRRRAELAEVLCQVARLQHLPKAGTVSAIHAFEAIDRQIPQCSSIFDREAGWGALDGELSMALLDVASLGIDRAGTMPRRLAMRPPQLNVSQLTREFGKGQVRSNADLIKDVAARADKWGNRQGLTHGPRAGTLKHGRAKRMLDKYQGIYGDRGLSTEVRYVDGEVWKSGMPTKGSVRLDVVEGPVDLPTAVYDYKFGGASLSDARIAQIQRVARLNPGVPIIKVKP